MVCCLLFVSSMHVVSKKSHIIRCHLSLFFVRCLICCCLRFVVSCCLFGGLCLVFCAWCFAFGVLCFGVMCLVFDVVLCYH